MTTYVSKDEWKVWCYEAVQLVLIWATEYFFLRGQRHGDGRRYETCSASDGQEPAREGRSFRNTGTAPVNVT
jgi:hypothetical protein